MFFNFFWRSFEFLNSKKTLKKIQDLSSNFEKLDFEDLQKEAKNLSFEIQGYLKKNKKKLKKIDRSRFLVGIFSISKEFLKRKFGISLFPTQIIGSIALDNGNVCQMNTGEGKTLTAIVASCFNAILGRTVYVVTVNDYLAKRDWEIGKHLFDFFDISSGVNVGKKDLSEKKKLYSDSSIIYTTASELCFDYLKYNLLCKSINEKCSIKFDFAIIDEIDSILIDNSQNPLIISSSRLSEDYQQNNDFTFSMKIAKDLLINDDYSVDYNERLISLRRSGIKKIQDKFQIDNLFSFENSEKNFLIYNCLNVLHFYKKGVDYIIDKNQKIKIIDSLTGRISHNRVYEYGIQQSIEAKENTKLTLPGRTNSRITFPNFFRMFEKISGMSGTAKFEKEEFKKIYGMDVIKIPPYKPLIRKDKNDLLFLNDKVRYEYLFNLINKNIKNDRKPILIGVQDLNSSEYLSSVLEDMNIKHSKLNAINDEKEAEIISEAGQIGSLTIATNIAGRGTDIILTNESIERGGLLVLVLGRSPISRRIDDQFIGRSGRQGNPGETQFLLSLEDEIFKNFELISFNKIMFENLESSFSKNGNDNFIFGKMLNFLVSNYQTNVRSLNFMARRSSLEYDLSLNKSRKEFYSYRKKILELNNRDVVSFILEDKEISSSVFFHSEEFENFCKLIRKKVILESDLFWSSYLKITEKTLKTIFVKIYSSRNTQESFFLEINRIFKRSFYFFKLRAKNITFKIIKRFLLELKSKISNIDNQKESFELES